MLPGRILVEIFEPELPVTCRNFLNRCNPGAGNTFKGTKVDRVVENYALYAGVSKGYVLPQPQYTDTIVIGNAKDQMEDLKFRYCCSLHLDVVA